MITAYNFIHAKVTAESGATVNIKHYTDTGESAVDKQAIIDLLVGEANKLGEYSHESADAGEKLGYLIAKTELLRVIIRLLEE